MGRVTSLKDALRRAAAWSSTSSGLACVFAAGLILRFWLARGGGFPFDMSTFAAWADRLANIGTRRFYSDPSYFVDYPPGYLYVLLVVGKLSRLAANAPPSTLLLKLPGIFADMGLAWLALVGARRVTPVRSLRAAPWIPTLAAAVVLFNPAVFFVSAVWGQVDSVLALLVLGGFLLIGTGPATVRREVGGIACLSAGILTKPQAAFVVPAAVLILLWRHVGPGARARPAGLARVAGLGLIGAGVFLALAFPFGLGARELIRFYMKAGSTYPYTSVWAFNFWGAAGFWKHDSSGPDVYRVFGVRALIVGLAAFVAGSVAVLAREWRVLRDGQDEGRTLLFAGVALTLLPFAVLTRIHERYLFLAVACLAPLVAYRGLRRAFAVISALYFANVYFAYVYYVEYSKRKAIRLPLFDTFYGTEQHSAQKIVLSIVTAVLCLLVAWRGWRWMSAGDAPAEVEPASPAGEEPLPEETGEPARRWALDLHAVGRRGAAVALVALVVALPTRLIGLGTVPGMYFDEVYHARTAGEYLQRKEVYEFTHPPLAKELIAVSIAKFSSFGVKGHAPASAGLAAGIADISGGKLVWAVPGPSGGVVRTGPIGDDCVVRPSRMQAQTDVVPHNLAATSDGVVVAGGSAAGPAVARIARGKQTWRSQLPGAPVALAQVQGAAFVVTDGGTLVRAGPDGAVTAIAQGALALSPDEAGGQMWVSFPGEGKVAAYGVDGTVRNTVAVHGVPGAVLAVPDGDRILVAASDGPVIESIDKQALTRADELRGATADRFATIPDSGLAWAAEGRNVRIIEPRGLTVLGRVELPNTPLTLLADRDARRVIAISPGGIACASGHPQFAWRFGSAIFGSALAALVALLAMRLFGSAVAAGLAALFVITDGLSFTMSRISMIDSYVTAFLVAAWFCVLSAVRSRERSRWAWAGWLAAAGVTGGAAAASKWVGVYGLAAMALVVALDAFARRRPEWGLGGRPAPALAIGAALMGVLPALVYVASYIPYFRLGHTFAQLIELQRSMYGYHAHLTASHPYGSPWYGWPIGARPVWLYLGTRGAQRSEIWTVANPVVFIGGACALAAAAIGAVRRRSVALGVLVAAALAQYLPWTLVGRVTFLYHYLPDVPFLAVALGWWTATGRKGTTDRQRLLEAAAVAGSAIIVFVLMLPLLAGWSVLPATLDRIKNGRFWLF